MKSFGKDKTDKTRKNITSMTNMLQSSKTRTSQIGAKIENPESQGCTSGYFIEVKMYGTEKNETKHTTMNPYQWAQ